MFINIDSDIFRYSDVFRYTHIYIYTFREFVYVQIFRHIFLRNIQIYSAFDAHKIFPPHKMRSGNVDTSYYRYAGYGSSIFTISCVLYPYGFSDVIKIFLETGK